jgi:hypothetical protein
MSMPTVTIRRLTATTQTSPGSDESGVRIRRLLVGVAERRLEQAIEAEALPPGIWCVRRLDVPVRLDLAAPDPAVEQAWAAALAASLAAALRHPNTAIQYGSDLEAFADLIGGIATGQQGRAWAWRQLGLLQPGDADPGSNPREALLAAVSRSPAHAISAVVLATQQVGLAALHRILGSAGWVALLATVRYAVQAPSRSRVNGSPDNVDGHANEQRLARRVVASSAFGAAVRRCVLRPDAETLDAWAELVAAESDPSILRRRSAPAVIAAVASVIAPPGVHNPRARQGIVQAGPEPAGRAPAASPGHEVAASPVTDDGSAIGTPEPTTDRPLQQPTRPVVAPTEQPLQQPTPQVGAATDEPHQQATRQVGAATDEPHQQATRQAGGAIDQFSPRGTTGDRPVQPGPSTGTTSPTPIVSAPATDGAGELQAEARGDPADVAPPQAVGEVPARDTNEPGHRTQYTGLLFLLSTAEAADIPTGVLDEPALAARTLRWVLHCVATALGVPPEDPAAVAFVGLDPGRRLPWSADAPPSTVEQAAVDEIAQRWAGVTASVLGRTDDKPANVIAKVMRRPGVISYAPGWIEARMGVDQIDIDVRRAGLDLDPGWVPWLGTVVRYIYE